MQVKCEGMPFAAAPTESMRPVSESAKPSRRRIRCGRAAEGLPLTRIVSFGVRCEHDDSIKGGVLAD